MEEVKDMPVKEEIPAIYVWDEGANAPRMVDNAEEVLLTHLLKRINARIENEDPDAGNLKIEARVLERKLAKMKSPQEV